MDSAPGRPHEGFGVLVMVVDVGVDLTLELSHRLEAATADRLVGYQRKPTLDLVEP
jgi:hypothetical protein